MIIICGERRIVSDTYGYTIEKRCVIATGKKKGAAVWRPDNPAYPATLSHALELVFERTLKDANDEIDVRDLPDACKRAAESVKSHVSKVRRLGVKAAAKEKRRVTKN